MLFQGLVSNGQIPVTTDSPTTFFRGFGMSNGAVCVVLDTSQARVYVNGVAIEESSGKLIISETDPVDHFAPGAIPVTADGALVASPAGAVTHYVAGIPYAGSAIVTDVSISPTYSPLELFTSGEVGVWFDPSDLTTMFQDSTGHTPVTGTGEPVGLILDKSRELAIGSELCTNGDFSAGSTGWTITGANVSIGSGVATWTGAAANERITQGSLTAANWYRVSFEVTAYTAGTVYFLGTNGTPTFVTGVGSYTYYINGATSIYIRAGASGFTGSIDNVSVKLIEGAHAYQMTAASRPTYTESGGLKYLLFDGTDDALITSSQDWSATDELTFCAGIRKISDAANGTVAEFSPSVTANNGSWYVRAPNSATSPDFSAASKGTTSATAISIVTTLTAPITFVATLQADISAPSVSIRADGVVEDTDTGTQGTGNYGTYALYIGARNGSSVRFNGYVYGLVARGATSTAQEVDDLEAYMADLSGVTL